MACGKSALSSPISIDSSEPENSSNAESSPGMDVIAPYDNESSLSQLSVTGLFQSYWPAACRLAARYSSQHAEDLAQVSLYEATKDWGKATQAFRGASRAQFWTWIQRIVRTNFLDAKKYENARKRRGQVRTASLDFSEVAGEPAADITDHAKSTPSLSASRREQILAAIEKLPAEQMDVARLYFLEDVSSMAIAESLGIAITEVESRLLKIVRNLKKYLLPL